jgi:glycosyltransferase involved in cell wall biosynthesis
MGGLETYVRELVPSLLSVRPGLGIRIYLNREGRRLLEPEPWAGDVELVSYPWLGVPGTRAASEATVLGMLASRDGLDVLHNVALTAPLRTRVANVVLLADLTWLRQPETVGRARSFLWRTLVLPAARRADRVITLSKASRREIVEDVGIAPERVDVVPLGYGTPPRGEPAPEQELRKSLQLGDGPILLSVSALTPHKNVGALLEAIVILRESHPTVMLVVPGNPSAHGETLVARAAALGISSNVSFPGWVSSAELESLYRAATCLVLASTREGFGLPLLEAMARGLPVACSRASALPEVAGDAAVYFDPHSVHEIAATVRRLLDDPALARELSAKGTERSKSFTWRRTAEKTLRSFERALASR